MRITITNDEGEVYVQATDVRPGGTSTFGKVGWTARDEEGEEVTVDDLLTGAERWEAQS